MRSAAAAVSSTNSHDRRSRIGARRQDGQRRRLGGGWQLVAVADALAQPRQRDLGVVAVDLARQAVPVEDGLGQEPRGHAVADAEDRGPAAVELVEERVVGDALGDEDDAGRVQLAAARRSRPRSVSLPGSMPWSTVPVRMTTPHACRRSRTSTSSSVSEQNGAIVGKPVTSSTSRPSRASNSASAPATR